MCGIWAYFGSCSGTLTAEQWAACERAVGRRGPEGGRVGEVMDGKGVLGFTRLAINGLNEAGMQPFHWTAEDGTRYSWICNGEIYNWRTLAAEYGITTTSGSDCEILGPLFHACREDAGAFCALLDGVFAFVIVNETAEIAVCGRDPYGVRPLYWAYSEPEDGKRIFGDVCMASEISGVLPMMRTNVQAVEPGTAITFSLGQKSSGTSFWHRVPEEQRAEFEDLETAKDAVYESLCAAVRKRMMTERPVAALLSGGVDSSLIASLVARELRAAGVGPLKTFSIGFDGSEDLRHARMVADWIGSDHTEVVMTPDEFFAAIPEVIRTIQSYDVTTVRASVGNYLVSRAVREGCDAKVVFNGDGSDEVFGSYLYFYKAPSDSEFEDEVTRLLEEIHGFDVLRSDRSISANGLEPRTPFLDKAFVAVARALPTRFRRPGARNPETGGEPICEKWILRKAFENSGLLPNAVLWRRKEAFSDGVSGKVKSWYEEIQERVAELVPSDWREQAAVMTHLPPHTAEAYYYRSLFEMSVGSEETVLKAATPYYWMPRWITGATDPSARTLMRALGSHLGL
jgi:asparagine synthase (glutamine-hydrolysing)